MIKVTEEFYIDNDNGMSYQVMKKYFSEKKGTFTYRSLAYYTDIEGCIKYIMRQRQMDECEKDISLVEYLNKCVEINAEMRWILSQVKKVEELC